MRALSVHQPWASLIIAGAKPWEFRKRAVPSTQVGRDVVIHASKRPLQLIEAIGLLKTLELAGTEWTESGLDAEKARPILEQARGGELPLGAALGIVTLGEAIPAHLIAALGDSDRTDHHVFGWPISNVRPFLRPVPMRGFQGFWPYPHVPDRVRF